MKSKKKPYWANCGRGRVKDADDTQNPDYTPDDIKVVIVHRWSDVTYHTFMNMNDSFKVLELGEYIIPPNTTSFGDIFNLLANAGIAQVYTGYGEKYYNKYTKQHGKTAGCNDNSSCCRTYDDRMRID